MYACFILHNMILEDEGKAICCFGENANQIDEEQFDANLQEV